jgi:mono/diheme cytochrome c family protein
LIQLSDLGEESQAVELRAGRLENRPKDARREVLKQLVLLCAALAVSSLSLLGQSSQEVKPLPVTYSLNGSEMYKTWCASCHGGKGRGDGPAAAALKRRPADLTQLAKKNGAKFPTERVRDSIRGAEKVSAHGSTEMPVWGDFFRSFGDEGAATYRIVTLANYVESLQAK